MDESEIEKLASIIGGRLGIVLKKGDFWGVKKEGDGFVLVYSPSQMLSFSPEGILGLAIHEACHIKFNSHDILIDNFPKSMSKHPKQLESLLNVMENWRIENLAQEIYPRVFQFFKKAYDGELPLRISLGKIEAETFCEFLDRLRFDYKLTTSDFAGESRTELLKDVNAILPIFKE